MLVRAIGPLLVLCCAWNGSAFAAGRGEPVPANPVAGDTRDLAVERGVRFLRSRVTATGAVIDANGGPRYANVYTALAYLAFASTGHEPVDPTAEGFAMRRSQDFLLRDDRQAPNGSLSGSDSSTIHGHSVTCIALGEMTRLAHSRERRMLAQRRFLAGANHIANRIRGPSLFGFDSREDVSHSVSKMIGGWQSVSLALVATYGLADTRVEMGRIVETYNGIKTPLQPMISSLHPSVGAAALLSMSLSGIRDGSLAAERVKGFQGATDLHMGDVMMAWAAHVGGVRPIGRPSNLSMKAVLVRQQNQDGSWPRKGYDGSLVGSVYTTATALLALTAEDRRLAFLQRSP